MKRDFKDTLTPVEKKVLAQSPLKIIYEPEEKIPTIVMDNFPALGKLAALRFIEWAIDHPGGVISLPTGKTPEHFIRWVQHCLGNWDNKATQRLLEDSGVDPSRRSRCPDMKSLHFIQIDEFYPILPTQHNSFYHYVNKFYIDGFGLDGNKALLMDCSKIGIDSGTRLETIWPEMRVDLSLRIRQPVNACEELQKKTLSRIDEWCQEYEDSIRALGGIGFFLGGIGPDGHIGFNVRGSDHHSTTRLTETNYETQAASATDLGGMEVSRNRLVITIGLGTITFNHDCTALITAAGEAKAGVVADAIQSKPDILYPATSLHDLPNARFYITSGAAKDLHQRSIHLMALAPSVTDEEVHRIIIDCSVRFNKRITDLTKDDAVSDPLLREILAKRKESLPQLCGRVRESLINRIDRGAQTRLNTRFLHTEPHHDDIMLGYLPAAVRHTRPASNVHYFATLTSGFTAVTNNYMCRLLLMLKKFISQPSFLRLQGEGYFSPKNLHGRSRDIWLYLDGVAAKDLFMQEEGTARRFLRCMFEVFDVADLGSIANRIEELLHYFQSEYPGKKDLDHIQLLKGMCREWEAECLWGYFGWNCENVRHLRLGFYTGDIFTPEPTINRDVPPILDLIRDANPDIVTLALDPEASGPDTHYKALQAVTEALRAYQIESGKTEIKIWGYRNIWYRFHPSEATMFVPVSLNMFSIMENAFLNTFISQKDASFPSFEFDGPFCELARTIQTRQYQALKTCLGRDWFHEHPNAMIRATRGMVYIKEMSLDELFDHSRSLRHATENT